MGALLYELVALLPALCNSRRALVVWKDSSSSGQHSCGSDVWLDCYGVDAG